MPLEQIYAPGSTNPFTFDPVQDILGSGTVGELFKVTNGDFPVASSVHGSDKVTHFALKRFFNRDEQDDFANERNILMALMETSIIFSGQLPIPNSTKNSVSGCYSRQEAYAMRLSAYNYEFEQSDLSNGLTTMRRIGFHHDLKPANILLYSAKTKRATWKIGDFGSGAVKNVSFSSSECLYNRKASTGDRVYSALEYVVEGNVSYPKDIWSLGCIFSRYLFGLWASQGRLSALSSRGWNSVKIAQITHQPTGAKMVVEPPT